jgi:RNA polymerase sigma-70 factor, ECF subfamily
MNVMALSRARGRIPDNGADDVSFRAVFEHEFDYVWASLRRLGVWAADREDVAQDVFVRVHRHLHEYDRSRPIRPWLFAFATRCASDWRRQARHRVEVLGLSREPPRSAPTEELPPSRADDVDLVTRALECVDADRRAVFILHELDECPMAEIVRAFGIPLFTGYSRLRVARKEFSEAVRRLSRNRGER